MEEVNLKFLSLRYDVRVDVEEQSVGVYKRPGTWSLGVQSSPILPATEGEDTLVGLQKPS